MRMATLNRIGKQHISALTDVQLTELLLHLLRLEAERHGLPRSGIDVPLTIDVSDGGEDGRIRWSDGVARTEWIPNRFTIFQCKATNMPKAKCKLEVCKSGSKELADRVKEVWDAGGAYVLFYGRSCNPTHCAPRISAIREAIKESGANYSKTASIEIYDAEKIANWCNEHAGAVALVSEFAGLTLPAGLKTWITWSKHPDHQWPYIPTTVLDAFGHQIRDALRDSRAVIRIEGLSGLGKTRLVLETFRTASLDSQAAAVRDSLVYFDAASSESEIPGFASDLCNRAIEALLVVDNCSMPMHTRLANEVRRTDSKLKLITIDFVFSGPSELDVPLIRLEPKYFGDVVKTLLRNAYGELGENDLERIERFAQGFPKIAVLLAKARKRGDPNLGVLTDSDLVQKLVWGRETPDKVAQRVIDACAVFEFVGFSGAASQQRDFVATELCGVSANEFYALCQPFIQRGVIQKGGDYITVTPKPLALRLAARWWESTPPEKVPALLGKMVQAGLNEPLCDQIAKLDFLPEARQLTKELCGENGPFGNAEVLTTDEGSRIFRALVEVNPRSTALAVERVFGSWDVRDLQTITGRTRRNLVYALQNLCFWKETFRVAAPVLLNFAAAENERWANNASGQFKQLFHILLPGTQTPLLERLDVIRNALSSDNRSKLRISIEALGNALQAQQFSRTGGVEAQGSRAPEEDYSPTWGEVKDYWRSVLNLLEPFVEGDSAESELARGVIAEQIYGPVLYGLIDEVESLLQHVVTRGHPWPAARVALNRLLEFNSESLDNETRRGLTQLAALLQPREIGDRLRFIVSLPEWEYTKDKHEKYVDVAERRAEVLADELAESTTWFHYLPLLFTGEQRQGLAFGRRLAERISNQSQFATAALKALATVPSNQRNVRVLGGFLRGASRRLVTSVLKHVANDRELRPLVLELTRLSIPKPQDLSRLVSLLHRGSLKAESFHAFAYNSVVDHLATEEVQSFCTELASYGIAAASAAFHIAFMYCLHNEVRWKAFRAFFRTCLVRRRFLNQVHKEANIVGHAWQDTVTKLLTTKPHDAKFAVAISRQIVEAVGSKDFRIYTDYFINPVLKLLFERYPEATWNIVGAALMSREKLASFKLREVLGDLHDKEGNASVLTAFSTDFLLRWCRENLPQAPRVLARVAPLIQKSEDSVKWHPIATMLLDNFGDDVAMLNEIGANWGTFSWTGSLIPYYEQQRKLLEQLSTSPSATVRKWQKSYVDSLNSAIEQERKREEEERLGVR